jgi:hypothetical protein
MVEISHKIFNEPFEVETWINFKLTRRSDLINISVFPYGDGYRYQYIVWYWTPESGL